MKKNLLTIFSLLVATAIFAQQSNIVDLPSEGLTKGYSIMTPNSNPITSNSVSSPSAIWSDDCSDPSNWVFTNSSTLNIDWRVEYDPAITPAGGTLTPMASATASNGYMFVNSDSDGGSSDLDGTTISCEFTTATPIDLSAYPDVQLTFEHNFRWWQDTRVVRVSGDNGITWVDVDEITNNAGYTYVDQSSDNPHMSTYNISAVAGGRPEVLVQFYYNDNDYWAWYWAIDDIAISELPEDNIQCSNESMGGWWIGYQTVGGLGQDYTFNPMSQATANPYAFEAVLLNGGINNQDATMYVEVTEDATSSSVFSSTSNLLTLASSEQDTVAATANFTPANNGLYMANIWTASVGATGNTSYSDTATKMTIVTDYTYGKDLNSANGYWRLNRTTGANGGGGFEITSTYDMYADETIYSIEANIADWSIPGAIVYGALYEEDIDPAADPIPLDITDDYTIQSDDLGAWITLSFSSAIDLYAGTGYRIAIGAYYAFSDTVGINVSGDGEYSSDGMFDKDDWYANGSATWYTIGDIPMLRMNFDPGSVSAVSDIKQTIFSTNPNPSNGVITIELDRSALYDISVNNLLGQNVFYGTTQGLSTTLDLSNLEKGIYTIELSNNLNTYSDKLIVE
jgi:hypothetical protein